MNEEKINLLKIQLVLNYYKNDITDRYLRCIDNIVIDNDVLYVLNEKLYITTLDKYIKLQEKNKELSRMCELYGKSLYNADLKKAEVKINKVNQAIDDLLVFNDFNGITSGIGNVKEELKFYLSDCKTLEEFRNLEKGDSNEN